MQHLLGIGHLVRAARIARALASGPFDVTMAIGGDLPAGLDFGRAEILSLPPVKAGPAGFSELVTPDGAPFGPPQQAARRDQLLAAFATLRPDVLLIEAFPFGRRQMRFELLPLLDAAAACAPRPLIASSIRDILQENRKPGRDAETVDLVRRFFDLVLVHGDPALAELGESFPLVDTIADRLAYTGLVGPDQTGPEHDEHFDVIVSVGGGAVGAPLIRTAIEARAASRLAGSSWLVLTGPNLPPGAVPLVPPGVTLRTFLPDLPARLRRATLSISQAGYNTAADLLAAPDCRSVLVPYTASGETEQACRAAFLARKGWAVVVDPASLDPRRLAAAIDQALDLPPRATNLALDGAPHTAQILERALRRRRLERGLA